MLLPQLMCNQQSAVNFVKNKKRGDRRDKTSKKVTKRIKQAKRASDFKAWNPVPGKGKKKSHFDCGKPKCGTCHYNKLNKIPKAKYDKRNLHED